MHFCREPARSSASGAWTGIVKDTKSAGMDLVHERSIARSSAAHPRSNRPVSQTR